MKEAVQILFSKIFQTTCQICKATYDQNNLPTIMCPNHHICCQDCMQGNQSNKVRCPDPDCSREMYRQSKPTISAYQSGIIFRKEIIDLFQSHKNHHQVNHVHGQDLLILTKDIFQRAEDKFISGQFSESLNLCKQAIRQMPYKWQNFKFFGHPLQFWLCNQSAYIKHYKDHMESNKDRSVYDLLNLCLSLTNQFQQNEKWLLDQLHKRIVITEIAMGLGILYYVNNKRQKSSKFFTIVCKYSNLIKNEYNIKIFSELDNNSRQSLNKYQSQVVSYVDFISEINKHNITYQQKNQLMIQLFDKNKFLLLKTQSKIVDKMKAIIDSNKNFFPAYYILGIFFLVQADYSSTIQNLNFYQTYVKADTLNAKKVKIYLAYAYAMVSQYQQDKLIKGINYTKQYFRLQSQYKNYPQLYWIVAQSYKRLNLFQNCKIFLEKYSSIVKERYQKSPQKRDQYDNNQFEKYDLLQAQVYNYQKKFDLAVIHYNKYLQRKNWDRKILAQYSVALIDNSQYEQADKIFQICKNFLGSKVQFLRLGIQFRRRKQDQLAVKYFLKCIQSKDFKDVDIYSYVCQFLQNTEKVQEALECAKKWFQVEPSNFKVLRLIGILSIKVADKAENIGQPRKIQHLD